MSSRFNYHSLLLTLFIIIFGCNKPKDSESVVIKIHALSYNNSLVEVVSYDMLNYSQNVLDTITLDSLGNGSIEFSLAKPVFGDLKIGDLYYPIYLESGFELQASLNLDAKPPFFTYSGIGSTSNNYLSGSSSVLKEFYIKHPNWFRMEPYAFFGIMDSLKTNLEKFHVGYLDTAVLTSQIQKIFKIKNELNLINLKQQHRLINNESYESRNVPNSLKINFKDLLGNIEECLGLSMPESARVLELFLRSEIQEPMYKGKNPEELDSLSNTFPLITNQRIKAKNYPLGISEFLIAKNIDYWLATEGISEGLDIVYNEFEKDFDHSIYSNELETKYNEWMKISKGQPAPEITGLTVEGDTVSLSQLKGKIVYVDVWATWCAPCIAEFPVYKILQKEIEEDNDVEFLFVSVDNDVETWVNFLKVKSMPKGLQINERSGLGHPSVQESYNMWGIPRYILIDKEGKIVDSNAPRPSTGKIARMIQDLRKI